MTEYSVLERLLKAFVDAAVKFELQIVQYDNEGIDKEYIIEKVYDDLSDIGLLDDLHEMAYSFGENESYVRDLLHSIIDESVGSALQQRR